MVKSDAGLLKNAFEEAHRLESSARTLFRTTTTHEIEFEGRKLAPNIKVQLFPGCANRDQRKWDRPDAFDLHRKQSALPLGFGSGIHRCIGQMIARFEADALLNALVKRIRSLSLREQPTIRLNNCLRTYDKVPLDVELA
ncbi:cytochrome P450 [Bradyrhizobium jicamae]|uniref:cytochrome P450 n=1 Tax=Bradyrhizobium jicamae TaxID=280332 RepID=UPI0032DF3C96